MKNRRAGLTLVELMVGVLLVAIAAVAGLQFLIYCDKYAMRADAKLAAVNFAQETMENFYMTEYDNLVTPLPASTLLPPSRLLTFGGTRSCVVDGTNPNYKIITVTVTWNQ